MIELRLNNKDELMKEVQALDAHILIGDDSLEAREILNFWVSHLGWTAVYVSTAEALVKAANESCLPGYRPFDAIVTDISYQLKSGEQTMTGVAAARGIRKQFERLPILFLSGYINALTREEIRRLNADGMTKPFDAETLFTFLAEAIKLYREQGRERPVPVRAERATRFLQAPKIITDIIKESRTVAQGGLL